MSERASPREGASLGDTASSVPQAMLSNETKAPVPNSGAHDTYARLLEDLDPEYRRRYLSEEDCPKTKERTKQVQRLILNIVRRGPVRDCIEEMGSKLNKEQRASESDVEIAGKPAEHERLSAYTKAVCDIFAVAHNDEDFAFLSLLFDKDIEKDFGSVAAAYMERDRSSDRDQYLTSIMQDAFVYAQRGLFGIKNPAEH